MGTRWNYTREGREQNEQHSRSFFGSAKVQTEITAIFLPFRHILSLHVCNSSVQGASKSAHVILVAQFQITSFFRRVCKKNCGAAVLPTKIDHPKFAAEKKIQKKNYFTAVTMDMRLRTYVLLPRYATACLHFAGFGTPSLCFDIEFLQEIDNRTTVPYTSK